MIMLLNEGQIFNTEGEDSIDFDFLNLRPFSCFIHCKIHAHVSVIVWIYFAIAAYAVYYSKDKYVDSRQKTKFYISS